MSFSSPLPDVGAQVRPPVSERDLPARRLPDEPAEASYTTNHIRLELSDGVVDLVPACGGEVTSRPSDLELEGRLFVINAGHASQVLSTIQENVARVDSFRDRVRSLGWPFHRAVVFPASRAWVELGVALIGLDELDLEILTRGRDLPGVHVWDDDGLSFWPTHSREPRLGPVPVSIHPVEPGCAMRLGDRRQPCVPEGGPWVSASTQRRMWWEAHHQLMVSAFGCSVCGGRRPMPGAPSRSSSATSPRSLAVGCRGHDYEDCWTGSGVGKEDRKDLPCSRGGLMRIVTTVLIPPSVIGSIPGAAGHTLFGDAG